MLHPINIMPKSLFRINRRTLTSVRTLVLDKTIFTFNLKSVMEFKCHLFSIQISTAILTYIIVLVQFYQADTKPDEVAKIVY